MPTYEYKREDGTTFELFQGINDDALTTCPDTGQKVKRVISGGAGVVYKGDGFYITDYKNKENGNPKGDKQTAQGEGTSEDAASDSKKSNTDTSGTASKQEAKKSSTHTDSGNN